MAKGQAEIAVILGIVIVAAVVVIYAVLPIIDSGIPGPIRLKYNAFKASFEGLVREGSQDALTKLSSNGGYADNLSFQMGSVKFLDKDVPYWQLNGQVKYPDVKSNFDSLISSYITQNKDKLLQETGMSGIELGNAQVSTKFYDSKITVTVNMPTTIDDQKINPPYTSYIFDIQTRLSQINDFAKGFSQYEVAQRPLEYFTLSSMVLSPIEQDVQTVPVTVSLTQCGEYVFKSWWDVRPEMEKVVQTTLSNVYMPGKAPTDYIRSSAYPKYTLVPISGKRYEDLEVDFFTPDEFSLSQPDFQFTPDPISVTANFIPMTGLCLSDPVYVNYYLSYPAIVRVKDTLTQNVFQFAVDVYIRDNLPGPWANQSSYESDAQKQICSNYQCFADLNVKDSSGRPLDSAEIMFMGCSLGRTNSLGRLMAAAPCGIGPLQIYKAGYSFQPVMQSSDKLVGLALTLTKTPVVRLHFYEAIVQNLTGQYSINKADISPLAENHRIYMKLYDMKANQLYERGFSTAGSLLNNMPASDYIIAASLYSVDKDIQGINRVTELGSILLNYTLSEGLDGKDLYVYFPSTIQYSQITDSTQKAASGLMLSSLLYHCGLGPITKNSTPGFTVCIKGYDEI